MSPLLIAVTLLAGGLATVLRYALSLALTRVSRAESFPWAVLIVNVLGSAAGGVTLGLAHSHGLSPELQLVILTGVCGGLTTFSTFSVETLQLVARGRWGLALLNVATNLILGFGACLAGFLLSIA